MVSSSEIGVGARLDKALAERGDYKTRARAADAIKRGCVTVNDAVAGKPGQIVFPDDRIVIDDPAARYVSRGALKLLAALDRFGFSPRERPCFDVGASTGGFTQVLLERGAAKVYALDVGHDQLAPELTANPKVIRRDGLNARYLTQADIPFSADAIVVDVSFVSLRLVLPSVLTLALPGAWLVALVKPQFELGREALGKGGIVKDAEKARASVEALSAWLDQQGRWQPAGFFVSPIKGSDGNTEFLLGGLKSA